MLTGFLRAFRTPDLRRKLLFTVFIIGIFRLGAALPVPGISEKAVHTCVGLASAQGGSVYQLINLFSGGALLKLSVFALGIMPYITASIILQSTGIVALAKSGKLYQGVNCPTSLIPNPSIFTITTMVICMTSGTAVIMWLGELITDRGIGNGMSLMIFTQVIAVIPGEMLAIYRTKKAFVCLLVLAVGVEHERLLGPVD